MRKTTQAEFLVLATLNSVIAKGLWMKTIRQLMSLWLCLTASVAWSSHGADFKADKPGEILEVTELASGKSLDPLAGYIEDSLHELTIDTMADVAWQYSEKGLSFGYTDSVYWYRLVFSNNSEKEIQRFISLSYPVLDYIDVYRRDGNSPWTQTSLGDKQVFDDRLISHRHFVIPMDIAQGETQEWIFRVNTSSAMQFPINIWEERDFFVHDQNQLLGLGLYYGVMLIMVFYNLFVFFSVREGNYLYYVIYVGCMAGFLGSLQGINFQYLWPEATNWNDQSIIVLLSGVIIFASLFTQKFLYLKDDAPLFNRLLIGVIVTCVSIVFLSNIVAYHALIRLLIVVAMIAMLGAIYLGFKRWSEGFVAARYYAIAWTSFLLGGMILALNKFNVIPRNFFTENTLQIGSAMEVILLSFALADRLNQEKRERYDAQINALEHEKLARKAQTEALDQERNARKAQEKALEHEREAREAQAKALDIQKRATETLEERVKERTVELESVNRQLEKMSTTDALTNIRNRRYFDEFVANEFALATHDSGDLAVLLLDIDHFKIVNDKYGHQAGDEILRCVSGAISESLTNEDQLARYGGEEFAVVLAGMKLEQAVSIAESIRGRVEQLNFDRIDPTLRVTISIGVKAGIPNSSNTSDEWINEADQALYESKENGRNQVTVRQ
jgi:diguanylate cyclase (GGDEF)-like protein